jgi:serine/threonine-protein kinase
MAQDTAWQPSEDGLPRPGELVGGKYRIGSVIGTGGMGLVVGAEDVSLGRSVAIKFLAPERAQKAAAVQRFIREARAAASIQSENVVRVFEVGTLPNALPYIVMEHLRGADLARVLATRGPLPWTDAIDFVLQACEALAEAHGRGIVHRDLKPQNLFLTQRPDGSPVVKVLDFGISKAVDEDAPNLTATDTVMGTPLYMSPEQVRSLKNVDLRADVWALGSILFELLTASPIFQAPSASALCAMIAMDPPTPLRARRPDAPPALEAAILRCLHKDPAGRFQDVAALAEALAPFASDRGRASAGRIARLVRASGASGASGAVSGGVGAGAAAGAGVAAGAGASWGPSVGLTASASMGSAPTADVSGARGYRPSGYPPAVAGPSGYPGASGYPPTAASGPPTTQHTWQRTGDRPGGGALDARPSGASRGAGTVVVAVLGVLAGMLVLAGAAGAYVVYAKGGAGGLLARGGGEPSPGASPPAGAATAPSAVGPAAPASAAAATATTPSRPTPGAAPPSPPATAPIPHAPKPSPTAPPSAAPSAAKDAGAPAVVPPPSPPSPSKKEEDLEARKRVAQGRCSSARYILSTNDPKDNKKAMQVKSMECTMAQSGSPNSGAATCDRAVCRSACSMLQDQSCIRQLDYVERYNPLPF